MTKFQVGDKVKTNSTSTYPNRPEGMIYTVHGYTIRRVWPVKVIDIHGESFCFDESELDRVLGLKERQQDLIDNYSVKKMLFDAVTEEFLLALEALDDE